mmetsp:Transcript_59336/g.137038  ORF Transcript_59336/g.137038 Transcript_59336/m.137038 type:complete len:125 (+) Transcript_59336:40-414(+)
MDAAWAPAQPPAVDSGVSASPSPSGGFLGALGSRPATASVYDASPKGGGWNTTESWRPAQPDPVGATPEAASPERAVHTPLRPSSRAWSQAPMATGSPAWAELCGLSTGATGLPPASAVERPLH